MVFIYTKFYKKQRSEWHKMFKKTKRHIDAKTIFYTYKYIYILMEFNPVNKEFWENVNILTKPN